MSEVDNIIKENERRKAELFRHFEPTTGEGSILKRQRVFLEDYYIPEMWLPEAMLKDEKVAKIVECGSLEKYVADNVPHVPKSQCWDVGQELGEWFTRERYKHDFAFWAADLVKIEPKEGGDLIPFVLNSPQRKLITVYEEQRLAKKPIRAIIVKARQWGGSTATQMYMAWLQLVHRKGLNSLIAAQVKDGANNIKAMFARLLEEYPLEMLYEWGEKVDRKIKNKFLGVFGSQNIHKIPVRESIVQIGSAEKPASVRGENRMLFHGSEVASWKKTDGKDPEDIARSGMGGILLKPMTMVVLESTAERTGDYFHREWQDAVAGHSQSEPVFVSWFEIEQYMLPIEDVRAFAQSLWDRRESTKTESVREQPGRYLWWLWEEGATLEHIAWYIEERKKFSSHEKMAREYPSTAAEAFAHTQSSVFSTSSIEKFRRGCRPAEWVGEVYGQAIEGEDCLKNLHFVEDERGQLMVWEKPEADEGDEIVLNRYITVVDVGRGLSNDADYSDILVLDRMMTMDGGRPVVVAEWHGHIDIDLLAWKSVQIAMWYNCSLLVIESNTVETNGGVATNMMNSALYVMELIGELYPNLYYRDPSSEDVKQGKKRGKIGFHTNGKTKQEIIEEMKRIMRVTGYVERNAETLVEYETYEQKENGSYWAPTGCHDDRLMTRAIGLWISGHKMDEVKVVKKFVYKPQSGMITEAMM